MDTEGNNLRRLSRRLNSQANKELKLFVIAMTACQGYQVADSNLPESGLASDSITVNLATTYCQANSQEEAQKWADEYYRKKLLAKDGWTQYSYTVEEIPLSFVEEFLEEKGYLIEPPPLD